MTTALETTKASNVARTSPGALAARVTGELDQSTLRRAQLGDPLAFARLVELYDPRVRAYLNRMCGGVGVDDLMQETFWRVFRSLPGFLFEGSAKLSTWIMKIATRSAIDDRRRSWGRLRFAEDALLLTDRRPGPDGHAEAAILRRRVDRALLEVSEPLRATFTLRVFCELSEQETADILSIDVGTVKSRVSRVREYLRQSLQHAKERP